MTVDVSKSIHFGVSGVGEPVETPRSGSTSERQHLGFGIHTADRETAM